MDNQFNKLENSSISPTIEKPNKRRSAIFQRQSLGSNYQDLNIESAKNASDQSEEANLENKSAVGFDLQEYIDSLKREDNEWRKENSERKTRVRDLLKRDKSQEQQDVDLSCLSDSERAFLAAKPDYEEFKKNFVKLQALAVKVCYLNKYAEHLHDQILLKLQDDTDDAVDRIIKFAD